LKKNPKNSRAIMEQTGWFGHISDLLNNAGGSDSIVSRIIDENTSVLVHCSDGWDRTAQLVSLAQIMLDPYFRTVDGLRVLIEKEWLHFGHPFAARTPQIANVSSSTIVSGNNDISAQPVASPIFLLFLTCLNILVSQNPQEFEYNTQLLWCIAKVCGGWGAFGDFLCDNEADRARLNIRRNTSSFWGWVNSRRNWFITYPTTSIRNDTILLPKLAGISLWHEYYFPNFGYMELLSRLDDPISGPVNSTPLICCNIMPESSANTAFSWPVISKSIIHDVLFIEDEEPDVETSDRWIKVQKVFGEQVNGDMQNSFQQLNLERELALAIGPTQRFCASVSIEENVFGPDSGQNFECSCVHSHKKHTKMDCAGFVLV